MEIKKIKKHSKYLILILLITLVFLSGCGKKFWDYNCVWVSEEPYIYMPVLDSQYAVLIIDGKTYEVRGAWENDASGIDFCDPQIENGMTEKSIVWSVSCKMKSDELYMTVVKDNVSDYEGTTIVLHQQPLEETTDEETDE